MAFTPVVLWPLTLAALLNYALTTQSTTTLTTLIICSSREAFLQALLHTAQRQESKEADSLQQLITPTLHNLFTTQNVNVAFCGSVQTLLAHLSALKLTPCCGIDGERSALRLVLVNPLALHAPTPSYSAQGLSRTFAAAVETAFNLNAELMVVECLGMRREDRLYDEDDLDAAMADAEEGGRSEANEEDPWNQEVPILNVSARRFGSGTGERAWAGRTIKARRVAGRWFRFQQTEGLQDPGGAA
ncbi:uncharacterized protein BDR25DRAFT_217728 [Lindgomyces ingoldianus]|uniref:Uncharacterized protein n=1 Tax=Lindgomyces ingoldianus TaxID=673940 RepID=A0ACB6R3P1_9PLEO|nr:uncharacterized protein BDR25DRAFT_217728 [Lindgomyces ingoldianus]KAF2473864.1 hypothetical protein BDR25DRAFT_217728 [Lindgomyces ingoldianus]